MSAALVTLSHEGDFERCKLLVESVHHCCKESIPHYLIVPRQDVPRFKSLNDIHPVTVIAEESLLPWYVLRTPFSKKWRLNLLGFPTRGWIVQQLCKIKIATRIHEDLMIIVDSDNAFVRPFSVSDFVRDGKVRLLSVPDRANMPSHYPWHRRTAKLLGLEVRDYFGNGYIGNIVTWRNNQVLALISHLRKRHFAWQWVILNQLTFSEYILYGVFCEFIQMERSGHYKETNKQVHEYWNETDLCDAELEAFFSQVHPEEHLAIMISAKSGIDVSRYRQFLQQIWRDRHSGSPAHAGMTSRS